MQNQGVKIGLGQWAEVQDNATLSLPVFTAECWVKAHSRIVIVSRDLPGNIKTDWSLVYDTARQRIELVTGKDSLPDEYFWSPDSVLLPNQWNHIALIANGPQGYARVYVNDSLVLDVTFTPRTFDVVSGVAWGSYYNNVLGSTGDALIDEARYWNIERTPEQIRQKKNSKLALTDRQGLAGYWMFCGNFADSSGKKNHLLPRGNAQIVDIMDLSTDLGCEPTSPKIDASGISFEPIICKNPSFRDTTIWIKNIGSGELVISSIQFTGNDAGDFSLVSPNSVPPNFIVPEFDSAKIRVRVIPSKVGTLNATMVFVSNAKNFSVFNIPLRAYNETAIITLSAVKLDFGQMDAQQLPKILPVIVTNRGTIPLTITRLDNVLTPGFKIQNQFPLTLLPGQQESLNFQFDSSIFGFYHGTFSFQSTPCDSQFSIRVRGSIMKAIQFPTVTCISGSYFDSTITVHNFSNEPIELRSANFSGVNASDFSFISPTGIPPIILLNPGQSTPIRIRYNPADIGLRTCTINLEYFWSQTGTMQIPLSGYRERLTFFVENPDVDFGIVQSFEIPARRTVYIRNTGTYPITFTKVNVFPPDTFRMVNAFPVIIQPGMRDSIVIEFRGSVLKKYTGWYQLVFTPCDGTTTIGMKAELAEIPVINARTVSFGTLICSAEQFRDTTVVIHNKGTSPLTLYTAQINGPHASDFRLITPASIPPELMIPKLDSLAINLRFSPSAYGDRTALLTLGSNSATGNTYAIYLSGRKEFSALSLPTKALDFGDNQLGDLPKEQMVMIVNTGTTERIISQANFFPQNAFTIVSNLPLTIPANGSQSILVRFNPASNGIFTSELRVIVIPCDTVLRIPVRGARVVAPNINAASMKMNLLRCANETTTDSVITIRNTGTDTLKIISLRLTGNDRTDFSILTPLPTGFPLLPRDSVKILIRFSPSSYGRKHAFLNVQSNAANFPSFDIAVEGEKVRMLISPSKRLIDLGILCPSEKRSFEFYLQNSGTIAATQTLLEDASLSLSQNSVSVRLNDSVRITGIANTTNQEGMYRARIDLVDECGQTDSVVVVATLNQPKITVDLLSILSISVVPIDTTLTIRNSGTLDAVITDWRIADARFAILTPTLPQQLAANASMQVRVRFTPIDTSSVRTKFHATFEPCSLVTEQDIIITSTPQKLISSTTASHGALRCEAFRDTTIVLRNTGQAALRIDNILFIGKDSLDFSLIQPASIPPAQSIPPGGNFSLLIRFRPSSPGFKSASMIILSNADNAPTISIPLSGTKAHMLFSLSTTAIDFGTVCPSSGAQKTFTIKNDGSDSLTVSLASTALFQALPPSLSFAPGEQKEITVEYTGQTNEGITTGEILLRDECLVEKKISLRVQSLRPTVTFSSISFNTFVGASDTQRVSITNHYVDTLRITSWQLPDARFNILSPALPLLIPPSTTASMEIEFTPTSEDSLRLLIHVFGAPCAFSTSIPIDAIAFSATATVALPFVEASADTSISIPLTLQSSRNLPKSGATSFHASISFNRTLLLPTNIRTLSASASVRMLRNAVIDSLRVVEVEVIDTNTPQSQTLLVLDCTTGLGNAESTPLRLDYFDWLQSTVQTTRIDGEFKSTGICRAGGSRLLNVPANMQLLQVYPNPFTSLTTIEYVLLKDTRVNITITDAFGRPVRTLLDTPQVMGSQSISFDASHLPSGVYRCVLQTPTETHMRVLTLVK